MYKYKLYPKYKESGVEWLGEIPEHWKYYRIDWISNIIRGNTGFKKDELLDNGKYVALQYGKTYKVDEVTQSFSFYVNEEFYKDTQLVHYGDTILISTSETVEDLGHSCFYNRNDLGLIGGEQILLKPNTQLLYEKYLYYYSTIFSDELRKYATGLKVFRFSIDDLKNIFFSLPPIQEQQTIANYLDKATAKIDTLIQKQERLIELLKEKRQALISHAVTKGLNPDVKMKDSRIEWLGEIPEHWTVKKLKHIGEAIIGLTYSPNNIVDENEGTLVLRSSNLQNGGLYYGDNVYVNSYIPNKLITKSGDIVICSRNGSRKLIGKNAMIDKQSAGVSFGAFTSVFRSKQNPFVFYILNSSLFKYQSGRFMTTTINQLTTGTLNEFQIALPSDSEQSEIVNYLDDRTSKIDTLINKATKAIELLKERRTALISAVVTGKIDVREFND